MKMSCDSSIADLTMEMLEDDCREAILSHIKELHEAVVEMKSAFTVAQLQLQNVSMDEEALRNVKTDVESHRTECERQSADILQLLLALKGEVTCVKEALQSTQFIQHGMQSCMHTMMLERDLLLDELGKSGAISEHLRIRLHSRLNGSIYPRPSSGSHSHQSSTNSNDNDSGVALLLEKAHAAFHHQPLQISTQNHHPPTTSSPTDLSALANHSANANVQEYLNTLTPHSHTSGSAGTRSPNLQEEGDHGHTEKRGSGEFIAELGLNGGCGVVYDSDCSLTLAATKSLSLSNSLSKQCGLELDQDQNQEQKKSVHLNEKESSTTSNKKGQPEQEEGSCASTSTPSDSHSEPAHGPLSFKEGQRLRVAKELLETERKYCHTLKTIQETFAYPLKNSGVLSIKDINTLFPEEVFSLLEKHCILLSQLEERVASWKSQPKIGDILERFTNGKESDVLRLYTNYVNDFPEVLKTFHKLCRNSREFTQFLKSSLEHPTCGGLDLGAFLLSPVQRMPRYILLLKQIIKYTDPTHPDFKDITACLDRLRNYLKRLNDSMEHSFQLVTAQITPQPEENDHDKKIGFTNALGLGFGFGSRSGKNAFARSSICSSHSRSSRSTTGDVEDNTNNSPPQKTRYRRSTSVPRSQIQTPSDKPLQNDHLHKECTGKGKLKGRSKSDWTVCKACNCSQNTIPLPPSDHHNSRGGVYERTLSDSDINSEVEDDCGSLLLDEKTGRKFSTSKSLHDFPHEEDHPEWFFSEPSLSEEMEQSNNSTSSTKANLSLEGNTTTIRNNVMVRPLTSAQPGRYVARIQRGTESEMNLHMIGMKNSNGQMQTLEQHKKKSSLRNSLKNIFSLKKRYKTTQEHDYRVVFSDKISKAKNVTSMSDCKQQLSTSTTTTTMTTSELRAISISPLIQYMHRMPSYLELVMFSVRETTV